ncbi:MAG TPA: choice-of-anchor Q domain-containing protein [Candidatus Dormibacteraeota bacterium]|jgi:hypothetical protein|nr:choice-of-anchor Q domain-containing protein [Candidatus Dormibacteraeota bacterium]
MKKRLSALPALFLVAAAGLFATTPASAAGTCLGSSGVGTRLVNSGNISRSGCSFTGISNSSQGGAIHNTGTLTLTNVVLADNQVTSSGSDGNGGAIWNTGTLNLSNVMILRNTAGHFGGGIYNSSTGTVHLNNVTIQGNTALVDGGGIWNNGTVKIDGPVTVGGPGANDSNSAGKQGGGIFNKNELNGTGALTAQGNAASTNGGGIANYGDLDLDGLNLIANTANNGGGLFNVGTESGPGSFDLVGATISSNHATLLGGGIYDFTGDLGSIDLSTIGDNNSAGFGGGGIFVGSFLSCDFSDAQRAAARAAAPSIVEQDCTETITYLRIERSSIQNNSTTGVRGAGGAGGGIEALAATLAMSRDTVSGNQAVNGGGIELGEASLLGPTAQPISFAARSTHVSGARISALATADSSAVNLTISGNTADKKGGGIDSDKSEVNLWHVTLADNHAAAGSAGFQTFDSDVSISRTLVARNTPQNCKYTSTTPVEGPGTDNSANLDTGSSCKFTQVSDQQNVTDPKLGTLADNFGPTKTQALLFQSSAIDAVPNQCAPPATDERGTSRPQASLCDIGAYECIGTAPTITQVAPATGPAGTKVTITGTNFDRPAIVTFGGTPATDTNVVSSTKITATAPAGTTVGNVVVQTCRASSPVGDVLAASIGLPSAGLRLAADAPAWMWLALAMLIAVPGLGVAVLARRRAR